MANQTNKEFDANFRAGVWQLLAQLKAKKISDPDNYAQFAEFVEEYREWAKNVAQLEDLPEVPK